MNGKTKAIFIDVGSMTLEELHKIVRVLTRKKKLLKEAHIVTYGYCKVNENVQNTVAAILSPLDYQKSHIWCAPDVYEIIEWIIHCEENVEHLCILSNEQIAHICVLSNEPNMNVAPFNYYRIRTFPWIFTLFLGFRIDRMLKRKFYNDDNFAFLDIEFLKRNTRKQF